MTVILFNPSQWPLINSTPHLGYFKGLWFEETLTNSMLLENYSFELPEIHSLGLNHSLLAGCLKMTTPSNYVQYLELKLEIISD